MAKPITSVSIKEIYNVTPGSEGISQVRIGGIREDKGMTMLAYRSGDFWLEGHWVSTPSVCAFLTKNEATLYIEEPKVKEEAKKVAKADKVDLKAIVTAYLTDRSVATTVEVAHHLGKPTAVANSVLCALERRDLVSSKTMEAGITWKLKTKKS